MREFAAYVRVSKVGDREGESFHSPQQQEEACRAAAPGEIVAVYADLDASGLTFVRDGLGRMLAWLREDPAARGVIAYDTSRLGRSTKDVLALIDEIEAMGAAVMTVNERIDNQTPEGRWMLTQFVGMHEFYSRSIGRRWRGVHERRLTAGKPSSGQRVFGYRMGPDGVHVPDEVEGPILRDLYLAYLRGESTKALVSDLNKRGVTSTRGGEFAVGSLVRTLDTGFGAGLLHRSTTGEYLPGKHEAVITEGEWEAYRRRRAARRQVGPHTRAAKYMLSGIVYCGLCGGRMHTSSYKGAIGVRYRCGAYVTKGTCTGTSMYRVPVEQIVGLWLGGQWGTVTAVVSERVERGEERAKIRERLDTQAAERERLQQALVRLAERLAEDLVDRDTYRLARESYAAKITDLDAQTAQAQLELDALKDLPEDLYERFEAAVAGEMSMAEWNTVLQRVIKTVHVHPDRVVITPVTGAQATFTR